MPAPSISTRRRRSPTSSAPWWSGRCRLLRALGPGFDPAIVAAIDARLRSVENGKSVAVLLAIESGSRAWGFPSPDSDYDCRFIYVRSRDDYLSLFSRRDVIDFPPETVLDVNGWDLAKALRLLLKGNAVVIEWLMSPFVYSGDGSFRRQALELARKTVHPAAIARHYVHLGERQRRTYFADDHPFEIKKMFYALRPALALRWLRLHSGEAVAPMHFPTLVQQSEVPAEVTQVIDELLARKAVTRELGVGSLPGAIRSLIDSEFATARDLWPSETWRPDATDIQAADDLFRRWMIPSALGPATTPAPD
jgi:uncharacterized protein